MQTIYLDKTISLTRAMINKDMGIPSFIKVVKELGAIRRFSFVNSRVEMPIEHLGLAVLAYKNAVEQYSVTRVEKENATGKIEETSEFDPLIGTGCYIADFLQSMSPDVLNWYSKDGNILEIKQIGNKVIHANLSNYNQCKVYNDEGEDLRQLAVEEAYSQAVKGYVSNALSNIKNSGDVESVSSLHDFMAEDSTKFSDALGNLELESVRLVLNPSQDISVQDDIAQDINSPSESLQDGVLLMIDPQNQNEKVIQLQSTQQPQIEGQITPLEQ